MRNTWIRLFRRIPVRIAVVLAHVGLVLGLGLGLATSAHANVPSEICSVNYYTQCMNAWNGGPDVDIYNGDVQNGFFFIDQINPCNSTPAGVVTGTCPFAVGSGMNNAELGKPIVQLVDGNNSECVGTNTNGQQAILTACNNSRGGGGGDGTIMVYSLSGCHLLADKYWSDYNYYEGYSGYGELTYLEAGSNNGNAVSLNSIDYGVCWNQYN